MVFSLYSGCVKWIYTILFLLYDDTPHDLFVFLDGSILFVLSTFPV